MELFRGLLASESSLDFNGPTSGDLSTDSSVTIYDSTIVSIAIRSGTRIASILVLASSSLRVSSEASVEIFDSLQSQVINELLNDDLSSDTDGSETTASDGLQSESFIDEHTNVLTETTGQETTELVDRSQYNSLPPAVQVLVNDIHLILLEGEQSEQVFAVRNSTTNDIVQVLIFVQIYWAYVVDALDYRLVINYRRRVARSAVGTMTKVEITAASDNPGDDPENKEGNEDTRCPICFDEWEDGDDVRETDCHHKYHAPCIEQWLILDQRGSCPICRFQIASTRIDRDQTLRLW